MQIYTIEKILFRLVLIIGVFELKGKNNFRECCQVFADKNLSKVWIQEHFKNKNKKVEIFKYISSTKKLPEQLQIWKELKKKQWPPWDLKVDFLAHSMKKKGIWMERAIKNTAILECFDRN